MEFLKNLRVGVRLGLAFAVLLALMLAMAGVGALLVKSINAYAEFYPENILPSLRLIHQIDAGVANVRRLEQQNMLTIGDTAKKALAAEAMKARQDLRQRLKDYEALVDDDEDRALMTKVGAGAEAYFKLQDKVLEASDEGDIDTARTLSANEGGATFGPLRQDVAAWWDHNEKLAAVATESAAPKDLRDCKQGDYPEELNAEVAENEIGVSGRDAPRDDRGREIHLIIVREELRELEKLRME